MADFNEALPKILKDEGGFQNDSRDSANYVDGVLIGTNRGISAQGFKAFYGYTPTVQDMINLTAQQAGAIFKKNYWDVINGNNIENFSVAQMMMQFIIGSGSSQLSDIKAIANATAGRKLITENDFAITKNEADIINGLNAEQFWNNLKAWRLAFYNRLASSNPAKYGGFIAEWTNRLNSYTFSATDLKKKL